jgi:hypothetical protein
LNQNIGLNLVEWQHLVDIGRGVNPTCPTFNEHVTTLVYELGQLRQWLSATLYDDHGNGIMDTQRFVEDPPLERGGGTSLVVQFIEQDSRGKVNWV